jgi:hypothetical protein
MEMSNKAIIFTIDAVIALAIAFIFISAALSYVSNLQSGAGNELVLNQMTLDSLALLEFNGDLSIAVNSTSVNVLSSYLNSTQKNICGRIEIYDTSETLLLSVLKSGCQASDHVSLSRRVFFFGDDVYMAKMEAWFK